MSNDFKAYTLVNLFCMRYLREGGPFYNNLGGSLHACKMNKPLVAKYEGDISTRDDSYIFSTTIITLILFIS